MTGKHSSKESKSGRVDRLYNEAVEAQDKYLQTGQQIDQELADRAWDRYTGSVVEPGEGKHRKGDE